MAQVQADMRRCYLHAYVGRALIEKADANDMPVYRHTGFSVDAGVCIEAQPRRPGTITTNLTDP